MINIAKIVIEIPEYENFQTATFEGVTPKKAYWIFKVLGRKPRQVKTTEIEEEKELIV